MFKYKTINDQLPEERRKTEALRAEMLQKDADIDYLAMMCDIELDTQEELPNE